MYFIKIWRKASGVYLLELFLPNFIQSLWVLNAVDLGFLCEKSLKKERCA